MINVGIIVGNITLGHGTERAVANLVNMLSSQGTYNITIISLYSHPCESCYFELTSSVHIEHLNLSNASILKRFVGYFEFIKKTQDILKKRNICLLLGTTHALNCLMIFFSRNIKKIGCEHMSYMASPKLSRFFRRICYKKLNAIVTLTNKDAEHYSFIEKSRLFVIPNSLSFFYKSPATLINKRIIAAGRLTEQKGFDMLIEAAQIIKRYTKGWSIDIFGEGEDEEKLIKLMHEKELTDFVSIKSPVKNIQLELLNSSIYVMSSRWEGLPMILLETKACGLPIVSFDCPEGPADIIDSGYDGYLVKLNDVEELANKIVLLCNDFDLRKKMGNMAYVNSQKFSSSEILKRWVELFTKMQKERL